MFENDVEDFVLLPLNFSGTYDTLIDLIDDDAAKETARKGKKPSARSHVYVQRNFISHLSKLDKQILSHSDDRILTHEDKKKRDKLIDYRINLVKMWRRIYKRLNKGFGPFTTKDVKYQIKKNIIKKLKQVLDRDENK
jgi:hypothetical protein